MEKKKTARKRQLTEYPIKIQSRSFPGGLLLRRKKKYRSVGPSILSNPNRPVATIRTEESPLGWFANRRSKVQTKNRGLYQTELRTLAVLLFINIRGNDNASVKMETSLVRMTFHGRVSICTCFE